MSQKAFTYRALVDTNVLINDILYRRYDRKTGREAHLALAFVNKGRNRLQTYIASIALLQVHSTLSRAKVPNDVITVEIKEIMSRHEVISFTEQDIDNALALQARDIEDAMQYVLARKTKCLYIITANIKDFVSFAGVEVVHPRRIKEI